tara:strand:- start:272 stop:934 length:663 start_codon:yes stop_codon:yes gene_type:complete
MIISKTNLYWILIPGFLLSLLTIFLAIWFGEFETTIFGPGDDVRFGTWHLNTWWEWSLWFALQLALGILDVFFYEYVQPHFNFVVNDDTYEIKQYGTGTQSDILWLTFENSLAFFPSMIRVTLAVLFVNTQILSVLLVQVIKEFIIFALVYLKLLNKRKEGKFQPEKKIVKKKKKKKKYIQMKNIYENKNLHGYDSGQHNYLTENGDRLNVYTNNIKTRF